MHTTDVHSTNARFPLTIVLLFNPVWQIIFRKKIKIKKKKIKKIRFPFISPAVLPLRVLPRVSVTNVDPDTTTPRSRIVHIVYVYDKQGDILSMFTPFLYLKLHGFFLNSDSWKIYICFIKIHKLCIYSYFKDFTVFFKKRYHIFSSN